LPLRLPPRLDFLALAREAAIAWRLG
jgi:hypothetical protein